MRILVVDADAFGVELVRRALTSIGAYTIDVETDVAVAHHRARDRRVAAVLISTLHGFDGVLALIEQMRSAGTITPVLAYCARESVEHAVRALDGGADDVIETPVDGALLAARIRAAIRRNTKRTHESLRIGSLELDRIAHRVTSDGVPLSLTARQYALLEYLVLSAHRTVLRSELVANVWNLQFDPGSNVVDVHVAQLRKRLRDAGSMIDLRTVRGEGYAIFDGKDGLNAADDLDGSDGRDGNGSGYDGALLP